MDHIDENKIINSLHFIKMKALLVRYSYAIILLLFFLWMCIGIFPLSCYESDSMHVIAGCNIMYNQGLSAPPIYSYLYDMQPLLTYLVVGCKYTIPFLTCEQIYCILSALCSFIFIVGSVVFINKISSLRKEFILLAIFFIPESYAISMYPNSAIFAAAFFILALNKLLENRILLAILLMTIAPLFRIDILIVYPVIFFIFLFQKLTLPKSLIKSILIGSVVVAILILCYWGLNANPFKALTGYGDMNEKLNHASQVKYAIFTFYSPLNFFLLPIGFYFMFKKRMYNTLLIAAVPILLIHILFRNTGCATKHFLYLIPFVAMFTSYAIYRIYLYAQNRKYWTFGLIASVLVFLCISLRFDFPDSPWRNLSKSEAKLGPWITIYQENFTQYHTALGIGAGQLIPTLDEYMLLSGNLFYPFYIHNYKTIKENKRMEIKKQLDNISTYTLLAFSWEDDFYFPNLLLSDGYIFEKIEPWNYSFTLSKGDKKITLYTKEITAKDKKTFKNSIDEIYRQSANENIYVVTALENQDYFFNELSDEGILSKVAEKLYIIKREMR